MAKRKKQEPDQTIQQLIDTSTEKVVEIGIDRLVAFENQPFKVCEDEEMQTLMESIRKYGILNPLIVMPLQDSRYRILSGHRRKYCAEKLGHKTVPVIIRYMQEEDSIITMVDSNLHREKILYSEKAFAYKMKNEALKRKAGKKKHTMEGRISTAKKQKTASVLGQEAGESPRQVIRYIRLTKLIPELLELMDQGKISFNPAVDISFLTDEEQHWLLEAMDYAQASPSLSQAHRLKELSKEEKLTESKVMEILSEVKKGETCRVSFKNEQLYKYFPKDYSIAQIKAEIIRLLNENYGPKSTNKKSGTNLKISNQKKEDK